MIRAEFTMKTAELLASFLVVAADRFKADAELIRAELKGKPHAGLETVAGMFDVQEREARALAEQVADADLFDVHAPRDPRDDILLLDPKQEG